MLESIINYFAEIPSSHRTLILVSGITIFSLIETAVPLASLKYERLKHGWINIFFTITTIVINFFLAFVLLKASDWAVGNKFGLLHLIELHPIVFAIGGLMLMDFLGAWLPHFTEHKVKFLWQFHIIHHSDQHIDVTTANRHHPGESILRLIFTTAATVVVGAPIWLIMFYQSMSIVLSQFNHANIVLPNWIDKILVLFICTPNMHHVHHHYRQPYSDSNFGNIFSFWDRIFATYKSVDNNKLQYGLDTYMDKNETTDIVELLKIPFKGYRKEIKYPTKENL